MKAILSSLFVMMWLIASSQNTSPYWSLNGNNNATLSHKIGTTNAVSVRFVTNNVERMKIHSSGNIGIGISSTPSTKLHVVGNALISDQATTSSFLPNYALHIVNATARSGITVNNTFRGNSNLIGISTSSVNNPGFGYGVLARGGQYGVFGTSPGDNYAGQSIGVYGSAIGTAGVGNRMGVYGVSRGGSRAYGVWGDAYEGATFNAAIFANGAAYASVYRTTSDRKFKDEIVSFEGAVNKVMQLNATTYNFKHNEYKQIHFPQGKQIGLIADELEKVFPELVEQAFFPAQYDESSNQTSAEVSYKSVNYQGLIPVLIAAIQEQQTEIDLLKEIVRKLDPGSPFSTDAWIKQNTPNPVSGSTSIQYFIPINIRAARILVTNAKGQQIQVYNVSGNGNVNFSAGTLPSGTYTYTLVANGKTLSTKKMIIAR